MSIGRPRRVRIPDSTWTDLTTLSLVTGKALPDLLRHILAHGARRALQKRLATVPATQQTTEPQG